MTKSTNDYGQPLDAESAVCDAMCAESVNYASANNMGRRRLMKLRMQKRDSLSLRSWLQLAIENSPTVSLFCDCSSRVDEAAAVERIVPVRPLIVS
jgi:hypothetical protein